MALWLGGAGAAGGRDAVWLSLSLDGKPSDLEFTFWYTV